MISADNSAWGRELSAMTAKGAIAPIPISREIDNKVPRTTDINFLAIVFCCQINQDANLIYRNFQINTIL